MPRSPIGTKYNVSNGATYENNHIECLTFSPVQCGIRINGVKEEEKSKWRWNSAIERSYTFNNAFSCTFTIKTTYQRIEKFYDVRLLLLGTSTPPPFQSPPSLPPPPLPSRDLCSFPTSSYPAFFRERSLESGNDYSIQVDGKMRGDDNSKQFEGEMKATIIRSEKGSDYMEGGRGGIDVELLCDGQQTKNRRKEEIENCSFRSRVFPVYSL